MKSMVKYIILILIIKCSLNLVYALDAESIEYTLVNKTKNDLQARVLVMDDISLGSNPATQWISPNTYYVFSKKTDSNSIRLAIALGPYIFAYRHNRDHDDQTTYFSPIDKDSGSDLNNYLVINTSNRDNTTGYKLKDGTNKYFIVYGTSGNPNKKITYKEVDDKEKCSQDLKVDICAYYDISGNDVKVTYYVFSVPNLFLSPLGPGA